MNQLYNTNNILESLFESFEYADTAQLRLVLDLDHSDEVLRQYLSIDEMREIGSFFTGQKLSSLAVKGLCNAITFDSVVLDPTCGAGNLLIECSRKLGIKNSLLETLKLWGNVLCGFDLFESFIRATKMRLILEALDRGAKKDCSLAEALSQFGNIKVMDAMYLHSEELKNITHAIMNPPFSSWDSPEVNYWKKGKVNSAGVVLDHYIRNLPDECVISAILPDVLRSGSRYEEWRSYTSNNLIGNCEVIGRFNKKTDVDVFLLTGLLKTSNENISWFKSLQEYTPVSEFFDVCIGPLVAYRDPEKGPRYPYVHPKNAPVWETLKELSETREFTGRIIEPPFVVIRRTSSPSDKSRASATIIATAEAVAVENHLIVIRPKSSTIKDCKKLLKVLKSPKTNDFLNDRMRCRHLTVGIVKQIPFQ
ncbi:N-6 DNA methylase [Psychromonas ossibalaenae]|uniref:N-6 DNA methylase n=1 Tax=Psychromonas ossibalaenae TaxID=444922 RepID=UPI000371B217|nr:N-6 DNA methylase [Psychromonas ossibalaenae]